MEEEKWIAKEERTCLPLVVISVKRASKACWDAPFACPYVVVASIAGDRSSPAAEPPPSTPPQRAKKWVDKSKVPCEMIRMAIFHLYYNLALNSERWVGE